MKLSSFIAPYSTSFLIGCRASISARAEYTSMIVVYVCLLTIMFTIIKIMPLHELGRPDITAHHMIWYFAMTEIVIVSMQGNHRYFGHVIADGELSTLIRRPRQMMFLFLARQMGACTINMLVLWSVALTGLWLIAGIAPPVSIAHIPLLFLSILMGMLLYLIIGYMVGMSEIFGSYSMPFSFVVGKLVFTCGGLFFPVIFFPDIVQNIVFLTPFPSVIFMPGQYMLHPDTHAILFGFMQQMIWLATLISIALCAERKLVAYVMQHGD